MLSKIFGQFHSFHLDRMQKLLVHVLLEKPAWVIVIKRIDTTYIQEFPFGLLVKLPIANCSNLISDL